MARPIRPRQYSREKIKAAWESSTNATEAARKVGCSVKTIYWWCAENGITMREAKPRPLKLPDLPERREYLTIRCSECGQRPAHGIDPLTGKAWHQCGCDPYPATIDKKSGKPVTADPTPGDIAEVTGSQQPRESDVSRDLEAECSAMRDYKAEIGKQVHRPSNRHPSAYELREMSVAEILAYAEAVMMGTLREPEHRMGREFAEPSRKQQDEHGATMRNGKFVSRY